MSEIDQPGVVDLVDAGVPADQGLSSLGLLMQLGGHVLAAFAVFMFSVLLISEGASGVVTLWLFVICASSCTRSILHIAAGRRLLYGEPSELGGRLRGVHRYIAFALVQSLLFAVILHCALDAPTRDAVATGLGLAVWPVTLLVLMRLPRFRRFDADLPVTEDKGFEGASIVMTLLGLTGVVATAMALLVILQAPGNELQRGPNMILLLAVIMLLVRSSLHAHAGLSGLRTTSLEGSIALANRYASFGVVSSFCAGGALLLFSMAVGAHVIGLAIVCGLCWLLLAWPMIVRRFFADRQFADLLAGNGAPVHRRAPDAGLTWLGWFLIAFAAWDASFLIPNLAASQNVRVDALYALGGTVGMHSLWWSIGLVIVQGWAGFELVRMSVQSKLIATIYGAIAIALTLYLDWPLIEQLGTLASAGLRLGSTSQDLVSMFGPIAIGIIVPVATIVLVHRKIAPAARARFRERTPQP